MIYIYGDPCFQDNSPRCIIIDKNNLDYKVFIRTLPVQAMKEGVGDPDEGVLALFEEHRKVLKGDDRQLFKTYFHQHAE